MSIALRIVSPAVALAALLLAPPSPARAQLGQTRAVEGVGVEEHLQQALPLDAILVDQDGAEVRLGALFDEEQPVVLVFNYHRCVVLCDMILKATVDALAELDWTIGREYRLVSISIDPRDGPGTSRAKLAQARGDYGRGTEAGWHFLTTRDEAVARRVADAAGFRYVWDEQQAQYRHPAVLMLATPTGRMARYLYGMRFEPEDLRLGLLEASRGESLSTTDRLLIYCYRYDPAGGGYVLVAENVIKIFGAVTALVLGTFLVVLWRRELRRRA